MSKSQRLLYIAMVRMQCATSDEATSGNSPPIENSFKSQIHRTVQEHKLQKSADPAVAATDPLENYISIARQLLGPEPLTPPISIDKSGDTPELLSHLDRDSLRDLEHKEVVDVPTVRFRNALLKSYLLWVHPQLPILEANRFLCEIAENNYYKEVSPLLYHAVMFAASSFVDISYIRDEGYDSRRAARKVLLRRFKVCSRLSQLELL